MPPLHLSLILSGIAIFLVLIVIVASIKSRNQYGAYETEEDYDAYAERGAEQGAGEGEIDDDDYFRKLPEDFSEAEEEYTEDEYIEDDEVVAEYEETEYQENVVTESYNEFEPEVVAAPRAKPSRIIALFVLAGPEQQFVGYDLLQAILAAGLRFGDMNIFHRYEEINSKNKVLFSLASATEPGTFDIQNMGAYSCSGLTLFIQLNSDYEDKQNFNLMLQAAESLAEELGAEIYDNQRQLLTHERVAEFHQQINSLQQHEPVLA